MARSRGGRRASRPAGTRVTGNASRGRRNGATASSHPPTGNLSLPASSVSRPPFLQRTPTEYVATQLTDHLLQHARHVFIVDCVSQDAVRLSSRALCWSNATTAATGFVAPGHPIPPRPPWGCAQDQLQQAWRMWCTNPAVRGLARQHHRTITGVEAAWDHWTYMAQLCCVAPPATAVLPSPGPDATDPAAVSSRLARRLPTPGAGRRNVPRQPQRHSPLTERQSALAALGRLRTPGTLPDVLSLSSSSSTGNTPSPAMGTAGTPRSAWSLAVSAAMEVFGSAAGSSSGGGGGSSPPPAAAPGSWFRPFVPPVVVGDASTGHHHHPHEEQPTTAPATRTGAMDALDTERLSQCEVYILVSFADTTEALRLHALALLLAAIRHVRQGSGRRRADDDDDDAVRLLTHENIPSENFREERARGVFPSLATQNANLRYLRAAWIRVPCVYRHWLEPYARGTLGMAHERARIMFRWHLDRVNQATCGARNGHVDRQGWLERCDGPGSFGLHADVWAMRSRRFLVCDMGGALQPPPALDLHDLSDRNRLCLEYAAYILYWLARCFYRMSEDGVHPRSPSVIEEEGRVWFFGIGSGGDDDGDGDEDEGDYSSVEDSDEDNDGAVTHTVAYDSQGVIHVSDDDMGVTLRQRPELPSGGDWDEDDDNGDEDDDVVFRTSDDHWVIRPRESAASAFVPPASAADSMVSLSSSLLQSPTTLPSLFDSWITESLDSRNTRAAPPASRAGQSVQRVSAARLHDDDADASPDVVFVGATARPPPSSAARGGRPATRAERQASTLNMLRRAVSVSSTTPPSSSSYSATATIASVPSPSSSFAAVVPNACVVCCATPSRVALVPCGHLCMCGPCSLDYLQAASASTTSPPRRWACPICSKTVHSALFTYPAAS